MSIARSTRMAGALILLLVAPQLFGQTPQTATLETTGSSDSNSTTQETYDIGLTQLEELRIQPSLGARLSRVWQYQYQLLEQPSYIVASVAGSTQTIPNPEYWLQQHSVILQLSELFPRTTNIPQYVQLAYDNRYPDPKHQPAKPVTINPNICRNLDTINCLAGGGSFWGRLFSGATLTLSVAQRDNVQQMVLVPNLTVSQSWAWNGELDFNPAALFMTSANWKNAMSALLRSDGTARNIGTLNHSSDAYKCFVASQTEDLARCEKLFSRPRLSQSISQHSTSRIAAVIIPTFQLKALSQFDFIKQGGILTESPLLQRSLKSMTFTWDLRRLMPAAADLVTIGTLYDQAKKPIKPPDPSTSNKLCVLKSNTSTSYISVPLESNMNACRGLAKDLGTVTSYAAACAKDLSVSIGLAVAVDALAGEQNIPDSNTCEWKQP